MAKPDFTIRLGVGVSRVITKGEEAKRQEEEQSIKEGRVEQQETREPEESAFPASFL